MEWLMYALGILAAVVVLAAALVITLLVYFKLCAVHPAHKLRVDIGLVGFVACLSLIVRVIICAVIAEENSFSGGLGDLLVSVFHTIAGFTFNGDFVEAGYGVLACFYYGVIVYASLVFLTAITAGLSYEIYSKIQIWGARNLPSKNTYYVFTSITQDSLTLANDIKRKHTEGKIPGRATVIFFEKGEESFSRKNPLHRALMESGFYFLSDSRRDDGGDVICFLKKLKLHPRILEKYDKGEIKNRILHVFAMDYGGDYEGDNAEAVFEDFKATVNAFYKNEDGKIVNKLPTAVNYHLLTGGEINFESYDRRIDAELGECDCFKDKKELFLKRAKVEIEDRKVKLTAALNDPQAKNKGDIELELKELEDDGSVEEYAEIIASGEKKAINAKLPVHVFNEATLSSLDMVYGRKKLLDGMGDTAFDEEAKPDKDGAYRIAVIGFGKTGQYAMEELYVHNAHLINKGNGYEPVQFIADVYDSRIDEKSGLFAYNHPLFRCVNDEDIERPSEGPDTASIREAAKSVKGKAFDILYSECSEKTGRDEKAAKEFVDGKMGFPIVYMHKEQCFKYPFIDRKSAETAIETAKKNRVRAFVVALGNDESNIAMANVLIDSFRRSLLKDYLAGEKTDDGHVIIYVNLFEGRSKVLLNWTEADAEEYGCGYMRDEEGNLISAPRLSVIPFGCREEMYSYDAIAEDYNERLYNFGYGFLSDVIEGNEGAREAYLGFKREINGNPDFYRADETVGEKWVKVSQFLRLSNKSARLFAINYYKFRRALGRDLAPYAADGTDNEKWEFMIRLEHERWDRFFIAHGWVYSPYNKFASFNGLSKAKKGRLKDREKSAKRGVRQHNCLCPFDEMLDDYTKLYDKGNVELGFIGQIAYSK